MSYFGFRLAFHWPPFFSVAHLHLHAIAPASQLSFVHKLSFKTDSWWCVSVSVPDTKYNLLGLFESY